MKTMKALQVVKPRSFERVQVDTPILKAGSPNRILVRPRWLSMCGSDIPFFTGSKRHKTYPLAPGAPIHECVGRVVESTSDLFQPGDQVVAIPDGDQGLAELFVAHASKAVRVSAAVEEDGTGCLIQPLSTVMNAVDRLGDVAGRSAAVVGLGSIGLFFCWLLKQRGAGSIVGIDPLASRCRAAEGLGANRTFPQRSLEVLHTARQTTGLWDPPEICIEAVGHQMETLNDCLQLVQPRGTVLAFGVPDQPVYALEYEAFFRKNIHLLAVVTPDWSEYLAKAGDLFAANHQELEALVTHRLPIREAGKAFSLYERHEDGILKALLDASDW